MKLWWPRLYTIPSLKKFAWPLLTWLAANILCALFLPKLRELSYLVGMYPWYVFMNDNENTLASNMSFHRVHLSFSELRKAQVFDLLIQVFVFLSSFILFGILPWGMKFPEGILDIFGTPSMAFLLYTSLFLFIIVVKLGRVKKFQDERAKTTVNWGFKKIWILYFFNFFFALWFIREFKLGGYMVAYLSFSTFVIYGIKKSLFDDYHSFPRWNQILRPVGLPLVFLGLYLFTSFVSESVQDEVNDKKYSALQRYQSLLMFRHLDVELDAETVSVLAHGEVAGLAFEKAQSDVFERDVNELIKEGDYRTYYQYLNSGKVARHNLHTLLKKSAQIKEPWKNPQYYGKFREALVKAHPEAQELPTRLPASKKGGL